MKKHEEKSIKTKSNHENTNRKAPMREKVRSTLRDQLRKEDENKLMSMVEREQWTKKLSF